MVSSKSYPVPSNAAVDERRFDTRAAKSLLKEG